MMDGPITEAAKLREERDAAENKAFEQHQMVGEIHTQLEQACGERDAALERVADLEASAAVLALVEQHMLLTGVLASTDPEAA